MDTSTVVSYYPIFDKIQYGRKKIILDYDEVTPNNIMEVLNEALPWHNRNKQDVRYLVEYLLGKQDILFRPEPETSNINNKVVVNYAFPITREIVGYTLGNPVEYVQKDVGKRTDVETISDVFDNAGAYLSDVSTMIYCSICGVGYQITLPSKDITENYTPEIPITINTLDPADTFCVFSSKIGNPLILSCTIIHTKDKGDIYVCYTDKYKMTVTNFLQNVETEINYIGVNPITMFDNSLFLTGDWEQAISVMNASNMVASDSLNDIESTIRSLLVLLGAEFQDETVGLKKIKRDRLLTLVSPNNGTLDAKFITPSIDSSSIENIRQYLEDARNIITGIPDRQTASGGDTGTAVLNRNGWTDIEIVAKLKELFFKKSKKMQLNVAVKILQLLELVSSDLTITDIGITIGRHTTDNLQTKTQAFSTLVATGELATIDCLEFSGLTNRVNEVVERGEKAKEERQKRYLEQQSMYHDNQDEDNSDDEDSNNQDSTNNNQDNKNNNKNSKNNKGNNSNSKKE